MHCGAQAPLSCRPHLNVFSDAISPQSVQFTMAVDLKSSQFFMLKKPISSSSSWSTYKNTVSLYTIGAGSAVYFVWIIGFCAFAPVAANAIAANAIINFLEKELWNFILPFS